MDHRGDDRIEVTTEPLTAALGRIARARDRAAAWRERAKLAEARAAEERRRHASVDAIFEIGIGIEVFHVVTAYFIAPQAESRQGTYGSLGVAATLLFGLYLISRLLIASAVLNPILWQRRSATLAGSHETEKAATHS